MGSVRKRGKSWHYVVDVGVDAEGKRKQRFRGGFSTKREAEKALREFVNRQERGFLPDADKITFADWAETWQKHHATQVETKTMHRYSTLIRLHVMPLLGHKKLAQIRPGHIQEALAAMEEPDVVLERGWGREPHLGRCLV